MKTTITVLALIIFYALKGAEAGTNLIAIYLLDRPLVKPWPKLETGHIQDLKLISPPALAAGIVLRSCSHVRPCCLVAVDMLRYLNRTLWNGSSLESCKAWF